MSPDKDFERIAQIDNEAHATAADLIRHDISKTVKDIESAKAKMSPADFDAYRHRLTTEIQSFLPNIQIDGISPKHQLVIDDGNHRQCSLIDTNAYGRMETTVTKGHNFGYEKRGQLDVIVKDHQEVVSINDKMNFVYNKSADGRWTMTSPSGVVTSVDKVAIDKDGNISYSEYKLGKEARIEKRADGSVSVAGELYGGKIVFDAQGQCVEAPAGDGKSRKFHYDKTGHMDQIDGRLGHWDRKVDSHGNSHWVNKKTGARWDGEFSVDDAGNLEFRGANGNNWTFTNVGQDKPIMSS